MPVGLIVFGDKFHTDLHGALSLTPIIFTLTLINHAAQNDSKFWRPIGYIPNLGYRRGTSNKTHKRDKIQDKHSWISFAFQSLKKYNLNYTNCIISICKKTNTNLLHTNLLNSISRKIGHMTNCSTPICT